MWRGTVGAGDYLGPAFTTRNAGKGIPDTCLRNGTCPTAQYHFPLANYTTSVVGNVSIEWIHKVVTESAGSVPFFAYVAPKAAHERKTDPRRLALLARAALLACASRWPIDTGCATHPRSTRSLQPRSVVPRPLGSVMAGARATTCLLELLGGEPAQPPRQHRDRGGSQQLACWLQLLGLPTRLYSVAWKGLSSAAQLQAQCHLPPAWWKRSEQTERSEQCSGLTECYVRIGESRVPNTPQVPGPESRLTVACTRTRSR